MAERPKTVAQFLRELKEFLSERVEAPTTELKGALMRDPEAATGKYAATLAGRMSEAELIRDWVDDASKDL